MSDWSKEWWYCRRCYSTKHKHATEGYCKICYELVIKETAPKETVRKCSGILPNGDYCEKVFTSKGFGNRRCTDCLRREKENNELDRRHKSGIKI